MIPGRWFISPHAVRRYRERLRPRLTYEQALVELVRMASGARYVRRLDSGLELWRLGPSRVRGIVGPGVGPLPVLVTVLAGGASG